MSVDDDVCALCSCSPSPAVSSPVPAMILPPCAAFPSGAKGRAGRGSCHGWLWKLAVELRRGLGLIRKCCVGGCFWFHWCARPWRQGLAPRVDRNWTVPPLQKLAPAARARARAARHWHPCWWRQEADSIWSRVCVLSRAVAICDLTAAEFLHGGCATDGASLAPPPAEGVRILRTRDNTLSYAEPSLVAKLQPSATESVRTGPAAVVRSSEPPTPSTTPHAPPQSMLLKGRKARIAHAIDASLWKARDAAGSHCPLDAPLCSHLAQAVKPH